MPAANFVLTFLTTVTPACTENNKCTSSQRVTIVTYLAKKMIAHDKNPRLIWSSSFWDRCVFDLSPNTCCFASVSVTAFLQVFRSDGWGFMPKPKREDFQTFQAVTPKIIIFEVTDFVWLDFTDKYCEERWYTCSHV